MAQTNAQQRKSRLRARRVKRRLKQLMWAGVFVAIGATIVHSPIPITSAATTNGAQGAGNQTASTSNENQVAGGGQLSDGQKQSAFLNHALAATGASQTGYAIHDWTVLNKQFLNANELDTIGKKLEQEFALSNAKITSRSEQNQTFWQVDGQWPNSTNVQMVLTSLPASNGSNNVDSQAETVLTVTALGSNAQSSVFAKQYDDIEHLVASVNGTPQMSAYLKAKLKQEVSDSEANLLTSKALQAVHAKPIQSLKTQWEASVSGYAPGALTYVDSNGDRLDVQVAIHPDSYYHDTDVLVGTPIITTTY